MYMPVFGEHIVVLNSPRAISELLEKRSAISSGRKVTAINDL